ncbi:MAG: DUF2752 domain-containing protein [Kiritimatiellaeota bacterium]|nr:DUF2752 domain-containing protein [Kiritimatiellota bacterium]
MLDRDTESAEGRDNVAAASGPDRRKALWTACAWLAPPFAAVGLPAVFPPGADSWYPRCLFHKITGGYCLTCGGTRALALLGRGHVLGALHMNAVVVAGVFVMLAVGLAHLIQACGGPAPRLPRMTRKRLLLLGAALAAFWLLRNIPVGPFSLLAPR